MILATSCKKNDVDVVPIENEGKTNVIYAYYLNTKGICGMRIQDVPDYMKGLGMTLVSDSASRDVYSLNIPDSCVIHVTIADNDVNEIIDEVQVEFTPSEVKDHKVFLTYKYITQFAMSVGERDKMFASNTSCRYYGFFDCLIMEWVGEKDNFDDFARGHAMTQKNISTGFLFWLDESISGYTPFVEDKPEMFTGMWLLSVPTEDTPDEFGVVIDFALNQPL